ncbi:MAG: hypothetical protein FWE32_06345 [Oscillospiraceae bacterium]|nr:hypothetical protein [Oscillospiraceae bacterium]
MSSAPIGELPSQRCILNFVERNIFTNACSTTQAVKSFPVYAAGREWVSGTAANKKVDSPAFGV